MVETEPKHPSLEKLIALAADRLPKEERERIELHLEDCQDCQSSFNQVSLETFHGSVDGTNSAIADDSDEPAEIPRTIIPSSDSQLPTSMAKSEAIESVEDKTLNDASATHGRELATEFGAEPLSEELIEALPKPLVSHPRYEALELLGQGGMGSVFKARHRVMDRLVALKVIRPELTRADIVERFQREIRAAGSLSHPNIVTAHDAEQAGSVHFLVVEFVEGMSLDRIVAKQGRLPVGVACEYIRQAAEGLQHAYERGMVHRDIKPQNLMCTDQEVVKILDFGLAKVYSDSSTTSALTHGGGMMGTPDYIAPEQADDAKTADTRSDIYSLGCTLYFLLRGEPPYPRGSLVQKLMAHMEKQAETLSSFRDDVPERLEAIIQRAMAKNPDDRFQCPSDFGDALMEFASMRVSRFVTDTSDTPNFFAGPSSTGSQTKHDIEDATILPDDESPKPPRDSSAAKPPIGSGSSVPPVGSSSSPPPIRTGSDSNSGSYSGGSHSDFGQTGSSVVSKDSDSIGSSHSGSSSGSDSRSNSSASHPRESQPQSQDNVAERSQVLGFAATASQGAGFGSESEPIYDAIPILDADPPDRTIQLSLVLGIVTLLMAWIPCVGLGVLPFSTLGLGLVLYRVAMTWGTVEQRLRPQLLAGFLNMISMTISVATVGLFAGEI